MNSLYEKRNKTYPCQNHPYRRVAFFQRGFILHGLRRDYQ